MRPAADILAEVRAAAESGRREVQLLGQIVNHYQAPDDAACDFADLLARVSDVDGIDRVRFASPHPRHVTDRLVAAIRDLPKVCKHLHLPVQSGSDAVLKRMRRRYTRQEFLDLVERLRGTVPGIALSTDMIVGFPGETDADFEDTLDLVRRARFQSMYSFKYSPRPNTLALKKMPDDVPEAEKTRRILALQALQRDAQIAWHRELVGTVVEVLVDSRSRRRASELAGRTSGNTVVNFPGPADLIGRLVSTRLTEAGPNSVRGELERRAH
jgi:tRNA-2-methylthio-N6-dimethylallyladenosine synthase